MPKDVTRIDSDNRRTLVIDDGNYWSFEFNKKTKKLEVYAQNRYAEGLDCEQMNMPRVLGEDWLWLINGEPENGTEDKRLLENLIDDEADYYWDDDCDY